MATPARPRRKRKTHAELIRDHLETLDEHALRRLLLDAAERDRSLRDRLLFDARAVNAGDIASLRTAVRQMARVSRPLGWDEAHIFGEGLFELADMLRRQLAGPHAAQVVELVELAIAEAEASLEQIDDSDGSVAPGIGELAGLHLDACIQTRPDPIRLADRLFGLQVRGQWDTFRDVLPVYAEVLGDAGLGRYRERVEESWAALPVRPLNKRDEYAHDVVRHNLEHAMETLAKHDGDVDALIRIWSTDLSASYRYAQIAELCAEHRRFDEGLAWAERGMREMKGQHDDRLMGFCIDEHLRRRAFDRADELAWQRFAYHPTVDAFRSLMEVAKRARRCREGARNLASADACPQARSSGRVPHRRAALGTAAAHRAGEALACGAERQRSVDRVPGGPVEALVWPAVAAARAKTHPEDAIALYHRYLPFALDHGAGVRDTTRRSASYAKFARCGLRIASSRHLAPNSKRFARPTGRSAISSSCSRSWTRDSAGDRRRVWK